MERKLIKQGGGGYTIYLPKKWVDKKQLHGGDIVEVKELENSLVIGSDLKTKTSIEIELTQENKQEIEVILTHAYRRGFNLITLKNADSETSKKIKQITKDLLLGFEITETGKETKIENISEPTEQKYEVMLRKVFLTIKETIELLVNDFEKGKFGNFAEIEEARKNLDKFVLFCRRLLAKEKYEKDPVLEWELLTFLTHIDHAYFYLYKYCSEKNVKPDKSILPLLQELQSQFSLYEEAYFHKKLENTHKISSRKNQFQFGKCLEMIEKLKSKNSVIVSYIREIFRLQQIGCSPIISMNLNY